MTARLSLQILSSDDPANFSLQNIVTLLKIPSSRRQSSQIRTLQILTAQISFFSAHSELSDLLHYQSCQSMTYEYFERKQVVFNSGDIGDKFFIILAGKVEVSILLNDQRRFVAVATLEDGQSFGELALLNEIPRNATITCITDCHMAVLSKSDYLRILGNVHAKKISLFVDFLKEMPLFRLWSKRNVENLYHFFKIMTFNRNNSVFVTGQDPTYVYIVKSGEFEINKLVKIPEKKIKFYSKIAILGKGEIFGDDEVIENKPRNMNCVCSSITGELLAIKAEDFLIKVKSEETMGMITIKNRAKSTIRNSKVEIFDLLDNQKSLGTKIVKERGKPLFFRRKYIQPDEQYKDMSKYLELTPKDIELIKKKAIRKKEVKKYIMMNKPAEFSQRTPSPRLVFKSKTISVPYSILT